MKKSNVLWLCLHFLFLVVFNLVFFLVVGFKNPASVWISYGAIHFAYLASCSLTFLPFKRATMFGISAVFAVRSYFWAEFALGLIFILMRQSTWKGALIAQVILFAVFAAVAILGMIGGEYAAQGQPILDQMAANAKQTDYINMAKTKLDILQKSTTDISKKTQIAALSTRLGAGNMAMGANAPLLLDLVSQLATAAAGNNAADFEAAKDQLLRFIESAR